MSDIERANSALRSFFRRWQDIEARKAELSDESRDLFAEMKGEGYDTKTARLTFRDRAKYLADQTAVEEQDAMYALYWAALEGSDAPRAGRVGARVEKIEESGSKRPAPLAGADGHPGEPTTDARGAGQGAGSPGQRPQSVDAVTHSKGVH